jgi:hypothetical protein
MVTKHMFGKNSFDPEETFNTLVTCANCLALDQEPAKGMTDLAITVLSLEKELQAIKTDVKSIKDSMGGNTSTEDTAGSTDDDAGSTDAGSTDGQTSDDVASNDDVASDDVASDDVASDDVASTLVSAERDSESAESREAAEAAATAAEAAATEDAEDDDDANVFLKKSHRSMKKVRHHAPHHAVKKVHHRARAAVKKHVHHKRVVDEDLDLDQPDMAEY